MKSVIIRVKNTKPHPFQDARYGKDTRVCNPVKTDSGPQKYRDTVTGQIVETK